jgi:iron complex transport system substrate-binding protein
MKRTSLYTIVAVLALTGAMLVGCGNAPAAEAPTYQPAAPTEPAAGLAVVDALDRSVEFVQVPQRIVVAGRSSLTIIDTLYLFPEAADRVVGVVVGQQKPGEFLKLVDPTFSEKTVLEVEAGPEQIAPLNPDVVVMRSFMQEKLGKPLEQLSIPVVYVDLETPEQYFRDLVTLGQLFGNPARAEEIRAFYQSRLDRVETALEGLSQEETPRVLLVQYSDQGGEVALNVPSASWLQTTEAELAGGLPVWTEAAQGGGWTVVNFEQIAAWDPDKIFVVSYQVDPSQVVDTLEANTQWAALRAAQEGQIHAFPGDIFSWDQPDPRWILGVSWLARKTHPDRFADLDVKAEVLQFFGEMYGMEQTAVEAQIVPTLRGDVE